MKETLPEDAGQILYKGVGFNTYKKDKIEGPRNDERESI